ncbi:MAG: hypothetical protein R3326_03675 [Gemmatimonadota bacterium]|nr:hypothetical protein [Gemmatimonadota bacterium]
MTPSPSSLAVATLAPVLVRAGRSWIASQRERHRPAAGPLESERRAALEPFYDAWVLDAARVRVVDRLEPPPLVGTARRLGIPLPLEIDRIAGIAFVDTIVLLDFVAESNRAALVFHEMVHVVQYHLLGLHGFMDRYARGWLESGRAYRAIPLEEHAYELTSRFVDAPTEGFDVVAEVERRLGAGPPVSPLARQG